VRRKRGGYAEHDTTNLRVRPVAVQPKRQEDGHRERAKREHTRKWAVVRNDTEA
jgi:hypothetical protein